MSSSSKPRSSRSFLSSSLYFWEKDFSYSFSPSVLFFFSLPSLRARPVVNSSPYSKRSFSPLLAKSLRSSMFFSS